MQRSVGGVKRSISLPRNVVGLIDSVIEGEKCHSNRADFLLAALRYYYEQAVMTKQHEGNEPVEVFSRILHHGSNEWDSVLYQIYFHDSIPVQVRIPSGFDERLKTLCNEIANTCVEKSNKLSSNQLYRLFAFYSVVEYVGHVSQIYSDDFRSRVPDLALIAAQWHEAIEWADRING